MIFPKFESAKKGKGETKGFGVTEREEQCEGDLKEDGREGAEPRSGQKWKRIAISSTQGNRQNDKQGQVDQYVRRMDRRTNALPTDQLTDQPTNQPTDWLTNQGTQPVIEVLWAHSHMYVCEVATVEPCSNGPASNEILPIKDTNLLFLQFVFHNFLC